NMNKYLLSVTVCIVAATANAQQGSPLTAKDYEHAESFLSYNTAKYIDHSFSQPNWLEGDKFWYTTRTADGEQTFLVDPLKKSKTLTTEFKSGGSGGQNVRR